MKTYNSMYLGMCINNDDPEKRGRVQVFIPHLMPALYENWNEKGEDIKIICTGDNMIQGLTSDVLDKLKQILPWAEAASPILGQSAPGNLLSGNTAAAAAGGAGGAGSPSRAEAITGTGNFYDQSPNSSPSGAVGGLSSGGVDGSVIQNQATQAAQRKGALSQGLVNTLNAGLQGTGLNFVVFSGSQTGPGASKPSNASDRHDNGNAADGDFVDASTGRVLNPAASAEDRTRISNALGQLRAAGIKGVGWDDSGYMGPTRFHLDIVRPGLWGSSKTSSTASPWVAAALAGGSSSGYERLSVSADPPSAPIHELSTPKNLTDQAPPNQYGNPANQWHTESSSGLSYPAGTSAASAGGSTQVRNFGGTKSDAYATIKGLAAAAGSPDPDITASISMIESGYLKGTGRIVQGNNVFGQTITSSQIGKYGIIGSTTGADGQMHAIYDSIESAVSDHVRRWGGRYNAGDINGSLSNLIAGGYNTANSDWGPMIRDAYSQYTGTSPIGTDGLAGTPPATGQSAAEMANNLGLNTNLVNNTDPHGPSASQNLNGVAKGLFSYPAAGAMLWTFFREGNPLFPVYFACSYSQAEWQSAYRNVGQPSTGTVNTPGPGYNPTPAGSEPQSTGGIMNLNGVGGIRWEDTNNFADRTQDQHSIMFFGEDGSNLFFGRGYSQLYSKFNRRDQVEGDSWVTTLGDKEQWVQGDYNRVVMGDQYVKVGNVGPEAVKAVNNIIDKIKQIQAPLSETGGGGVSTPVGGSNAGNIA